MANLKINVNHPLVDGELVNFKAPTDAASVNSVTISYPDDAGEKVSKTFSFKDSHNNTVTGLGNLFSANALVSVIVNVTSGVAHILNADTNAYLESKIPTITVGTTDLTAGSSALATGTIHLVYE